MKGIYCEKCKYRKITYVEGADGAVGQKLVCARYPQTVEVTAMFSCGEATLDDEFGAEEQKLVIDRLRNENKMLNAKLQAIWQILMSAGFDLTEEK